MAGHSVGPRAWASYNDDAGLLWRVNIDADFANAAELDFGADSPEASELPVRSKMRHVYAVATISGKQVRKRLPCGSRTATAYQTSGTSITIDGQAFVVEGHHGEIIPAQFTS